MNIRSLILRIAQSAIARDSSWAVAGGAMGKGLAMIAGIVIVRLLGAEIYGEYSMIRYTLASVAIFSTFGLGYTATKFVAQYIEGGKPLIRKVIIVATNVTLIISGLMAVAMFFSAELVARLSDMPEHLVPVLKATALVIVFNAINTTQTGVLAGFKDFRAIAINNAITGVATFLFGTVLTYFYGFEGAVVTFFGTTLLQCVINQIVVRRHCSKLPPEDVGGSLAERRQLARKVCWFSLPVALQEGVFALACFLRIMVISRLAGMDELGLYTAAHQWYILILFLPGFLRNVIFSYLSSTGDNRSQHMNTFSTMLKINIIATLAPSLVIAIFSPLVVMAYGESFAGFTPVLLIAVATSVFGCVANMYTQEFISRSRNWVVLAGYLMREFGAIALALPLLLTYGDQYGATILYGMVLLTYVLYCAFMHWRYVVEYVNVKGKK